jgi:PPM family protein phosphatase
MPVAADCHGLTHPGRVRETNEDQFLVAELSKSLLITQTSLPAEDHTRLFGGPPGQLLLVADGMGGVRGGKRASRLVVETVTRYVLDTMHWFFRLQEGAEADLVDELRAALTACQKAVRAHAAGHPEFGQMGTTLTLAYLLWPRAYVIHAGDSRCYLHRGGRLRQVTRDHTVAQRMVDEGLLPAEKAEDSRMSHVLWSCISPREDSLNADIYKVTLEAGDTLLLCTDGLSKPVPDETIATLLDAVPAAEAARRLVAAANDAGGPDNVTAVVAHFRATEASRAA